MKKALKLFLVFAVVATAFSSTALADVSIGAWGRALWSPVGGGGVDGEGDTAMIPQYGTSWGDQARVGFTVKGDSDNVGFQADLRADTGVGNSLDNNDQQFIWVKPVEQVKFFVGPSIFYDKYRGNAVFGMWDWMRTGNTVGEDEVFRRVSINEGAVIEITPIPVMSIFAGLGDTNPEWAGPAWGTNSTKGEAGGRLTTGELVAYGQYGAGFDFGMGVARIQYTGLTGSDMTVATDGTEVALEDVTDDDDSEINIAVKLDRLVLNLYVDLGAFIYGDTDLNKNKFVLYAKYNMGTIALHALAKITLDVMDFEGEEGMAMNFGLGADMDAAGLTFSGDFRYSDERDAGQKDGAMSFLLGVKKGFSNGLIGVAFQGTTSNFQTAPAPKEEGEDDAMVWALPIKAEYWF